MTSIRLLHHALPALLLVAALDAGAHAADGTPDAAQKPAPSPAFDIVDTDIRYDRAQRWVEFTMRVKGEAGAERPARKGAFAGADVFSYVWPTRIDPYDVGFDRDAGMLALAVTIHPDFDDTPLFATTGADWHTHWVVLVPDESCGPAALKVSDIPEGSKPRLPKTWPGVPSETPMISFSTRAACVAGRRAPIGTAVIEEISGACA